MKTAVEMVLKGISRREVGRIEIEHFSMEICIAMSQNNL